jgi:polyferredoxin
LLLSLSVVTWLVLKKRSRMSVFLFSVFSLFYFGFYRQGCVCPIGSIQNVTLALADHSYVLPLTILIFFLAPLIFTLLFGRTFCAGVCPFGALQDMVSFKPMRMGPGLNAILGLIPLPGAGRNLCRHRH